MQTSPDGTKSGSGDGPSTISIYSDHILLSGLTLRLPAALRKKTVTPVCPCRIPGGLAQHAGDRVTTATIRVARDPTNLRLALCRADSPAAGSHQRIYQDHQSPDNCAARPGDAEGHAACAKQPHSIMKRSASSMKSARNVSTMPCVAQR